MSIISAAVILFLLMDPFGNLPVFTAILSKLPKERRHRVILRELLFALLILMAFLFFGGPVLRALNISTPALSIAGGVMLFLIAIRMIFPRPGEGVTGGGEVDDPFIVPLATPLIAGPSSMAMLILFASREPGRMLDWSVALLLSWSVVAVILLLGGWLARTLGERGMRALVRLMGMILITLAVQMLLNGITEYMETLPGMDHQAGRQHQGVGDRGVVTDQRFRARV